MSLAEAVIGTLFGFAMSLAVQVFVFPLYGIRVTLLENVQIVLIFTLVSIARSYLFRRLFNWIGS